jgi:acyl-CoA thioesterase FadM
MVARPAGPRYSSPTMSMFLRYLLMFAGALWGRRIEPLGESRLRLRVMPDDLDINLHMNNGRFLGLMDLGRFDLVIRMGVMRQARRRRWRPLVGSAMIRYRRSLEPFRSFDLVTRVLCWDDRWMVFEQRFERAGELMAVALVRALFRGPDGNVPSDDALRVTGYTGPRPPFPDHVSLWSEADDGSWAAAAARSDR